MTANFPPPLRGRVRVGVQTRSRSVGLAWPRSTDRVNLVYTIEVERIAFDWNRNAVPIKRDPL